MAQPSWSEDDVAQLRRMRERGFAASVIGRELGRTRNAVIGKINRMGGLPVPEHLVQKVREKPERPKIPKPEKHRVMAPGTPPAWKPKPKARPKAEIEPGKFKCIPIGELTSATCRYPMWEDDGDPRLYCGNPVAGDGPYCLEHWRVARPSGGHRDVD